MQLRHLATFVAIADCGTLTAAAEQLFKTQGAVSYDLRELERSLGVLLFDRSGQRVRLTRAGATLLPHAVELLRRVEDIRSEIGRLDTEGEDEIRIGVPPSLSPAVLEHLLLYRSQNPNARFVLYTEMQAVLVEWLLAGRIDIAVGEPELRTDIASASLGRDAIVVVLPKSDPLATREYLTAVDLLDRPFVGFIRELGSARLAERFFTPLGHYPEPVVELDDYRLIKDLIRRGVGYGILPSSSLEGDPGLIAVRAEPSLVREMAVLVCPGRRVPVRVSAVRDYLVTSWGPAGGAEVGAIRGREALSPGAAPRRLPPTQ